MNRILVCLAVSCVAVTAFAQNTNPVYRHNRSFYTALWTANPPEYTDGTTVAADTMHWRVFRDVADQRREPRRITGFGTWWQPSDVNGAFPQTINLPEFRIYPTTTDAGNLVVPDVAAAPLFTLPSTPLAVANGNAFNSVTVAIGTAVPIDVQADFAICGVYEPGADSATTGYFGFLPSASNQGYGLDQSYYGFAYPNGTITHFGLGGARSSIWYTEDAPTLNLRSSWSLSDAHNQAGHRSAAFGDSCYNSPIADAGWAGWNDSRGAPAQLGLSVYAQGHNNDLVLILFNAGIRFPFGLPVLGQTIEIDILDPAITAFSTFGTPIANNEMHVDIPLVSSVDLGLASSFFGFEVLLFDPTTIALNATTQSVWVENS